MDRVGSTMGSGNQTQVSRLIWQRPLPAEPLWPLVLSKAVLFQELPGLRGKDHFREHRASFEA